MANPNISASISSADKTTIQTNINAIIALLVFLVNLDPDTRKRLRKMATKREGYVSDVYNAVTNNTSAIPSTFDIGEYKKDKALITDLKDVKAWLQVLFEKVDDTILALGHELMNQSDIAFGFLVTAARGDAGLTSVVEQIKTAFAGQGQRAPIPVTVVPAGGSVNLEGCVTNRNFINKGSTVLTINKEGSSNVATQITLNPADSFKITADYRNITVVNKSATSDGAFSVKVK